MERFPFQPVESLAKFQELNSDIKIHYDHGTTTLGFIYNGGVILAVDSRATGGQYIGSQSVRKVVEINDLLLGTLAGGAADCVYWYRVLTSECRLFELRNKRKISLAAATKIMNNIIYSYKNSGLSMGMILAGGDMKEVSLYYLDSDGTRTKGKIFSVGSGSIFAYGVLDSGYKPDLTDQEAYGNIFSIFTNFTSLIPITFLQNLVADQFTMQLSAMDTPVVLFESIMSRKMAGT